MKNITTSKTTKIFAIIFMLATILGVFAIFPSAQTEDLVIERGYYLFNNELSFDNIDNEYDIEFAFICSGESYDTISFNSESNVIYWGADEITVYSNGVWIDSDYRLIYVNQDYTADSLVYDWFTLNTQTLAPDDVGVKKGMYKDIEYILTSTIYDSDYYDLDSYQRLTITNLTTIACVAVVALPLIVIFWLLKFVFSLFKYF